MKILCVSLLEKRARNAVFYSHSARGLNNYSLKVVSLTLGLTQSKFSKNLFVNLKIVFSYILSGLRASAISVKDVKNPVEENLDSSYYCDFRLCEKDQLESGQYHIVFAHPESLISTRFGRSLILSEISQKRIVSIVVDEAHCILDW